MSKEKEFEIKINGSEYDVPTNTVTYEQLVELAFPGHPNNPDIVYAVTFEHADQHPKQGTLASGGSVTIKKHGTIFDVTPTNRS